MNSITSRESYSNGDSPQESKSREFYYLAGLGSWCDYMPKRRALRDMDLHTITEELPEEFPDLSRSPDETRILPWRVNDDLEDYKFPNSTGVLSEPVPSLAADISTIQTVSSIEDELYGHRLAHQYPVYDTLPPIAESQKLEFALPIGDEGKLSYDENAEDFAPHEAELVLKGINNAKIEAGDHMNAESASESGSVDDLWLSDYSEDALPLEEDHPIWQAHGKALLKAFLVAFLNYGEIFDQGHDGDNQSYHKQGSSSTFLQPMGRQRRRNERPYGEYSVGNYQNGSGSLKSGSKSSHSRNRERLFACPFCKKDSLRYRRCYSVRLTKISYVKQHISHNHPFPTYCSNCMETFNTPQDRDDHSRAFNCQQRPLVQWEGVTEEHRRQMRRRPPAGMSEEEQWFRIFRMLFPEAPLPPSPYLDVDLSEQLFAFLDFANAHGSRIVMERLGPQAEELPELGSLIERVVTEGNTAIAQQFLLSRQTQDGPRPIVPTQDPSGSFDVSLHNAFTSSSNGEGSGGIRGAEPYSDSTFHDESLMSNPQTMAVHNDNFWAQHLHGIDESGTMSALDTAQGETEDLAELREYLGLIEAPEPDDWVDDRNDAA